MLIKDLDYEAGDILHWDFQTPWMATNGTAATSLSPDPLRLDAVEGDQYPGNTRYKIIEVVIMDLIIKLEIAFHLKVITEERISLGLPEVEIYSGASGVIEVTDASATGTGPAQPVNTR